MAAAEEAVETLQHFTDRHRGVVFKGGGVHVVAGAEHLNSERLKRARGLNPPASAGGARGGNSFWVTQACRIDYSIKT